MGCNKKLRDPFSSAL